MMQEIRTAPSNSLILVMDQTIGNVPEIERQLVTASPSCIAVGTLCEIDGETLISLSDEEFIKKPEQRVVFEGMLETPNKKLSVCSILDEVLMSIDVPGPLTRVQIWANHSSEPDEIHILVAQNQP